MPSPFSGSPPHWAPHEHVRVDVQISTVSAQWLGLYAMRGCGGGGARARLDAYAIAASTMATDTSTNIPRVAPTNAPRGSRIITRRARLCLVDGVAR